MADPTRILVTGASGFVGRHLLPALRAAFPTSLLFALSRSGRAEAADSSFSADLLDEAALRACLEEAQPEAVLHLAAQSNVPAAFADPQGTWRVNVDGSLLLARLVMQVAPGAQFVFASSAETYGLTFQRGIPLDEEAPFAPANPYAAAKAATDIALGEMGLRGLRAVRLRAFNHTGAGQSPDFAIPAFARQLARMEAGQQEPVLQVGALDRWRDFLDVEDVCAAYVAVLRRGEALPPGCAINIASGTSRRIGDVLEALIRRSGIAVEVRQDPGRARPTDVHTATGSPVRAGALLGWAPRVDWDTTLDRVMADWRQRVRSG
ncbi:GDP-mannose 4,6-dehydratase [Roseicella aquatilis]|uniref:NAD-dependent epimerase/dehydratase family protein n=1 Tax=Roseicella aquatilis TaxID=2527868 RepID=A0A4R4D4V1_9PROT|nr:GDP-mannose 4,6-dehydratase [Roseicella aquatilis]TCZ52611.1 NAD-dependent epimerase/dehydratase family protein [Roseicella aquatilis]